MHLQEGKALEGYIVVQAFKFYKNPNSWPLMQYKHYCTIAEWLPKEGGGICLWREDNEGKPILLTRELNVLVPQPMRNLSKIAKSIGGFINLWEMLSVEDSTKEYWKSYEHFILYWKRVKLAMVQDPIMSKTLKNGFWPKLCIFPSAEDKFMDNSELREEFDVNALFLERRHDKPPPLFKVVWNVYVGYFVVLHPSNKDNRPFWIAKTLTNVDAEPMEHPHCILIQYWKPLASSDLIQETYDGWDGKRSMQWRIDGSQPLV